MPNARTLQVLDQYTGYPWPNRRDPRAPIRRGAAAAALSALMVGLLGFTVPFAAHGVAASEPVPSTCAATAERSVEPAIIRLGEAVTVTAHVEVTCPEPVAIDVVLVIDRSPSMRGKPLADAKEAAQAFVAASDRSRARIGIVTFSSTAEIAARLARDARYLGAAIRAIEVPQRGGTDIQDGLWLAGRLAAADGDGRAQAIVLLSDGRNGVGPLPVVQQAAVQREAGRQLLTVALGVQADVALMREIATSSEDAFVAPRSDALVDRLERVAARLTAIQARDVEIWTRPSAGAPYVMGSSRPAASWDGTVLGWKFPLSTARGITATHRVRPQRVGSVLVASGGQATFEDSGGAVGRVVLPPAWVTVWDGTPTAEPTREPTATARPASPTPDISPAPSATGTPASTVGGRLYLPVLRAESTGPDGAAATIAGNG